MSLLLLLDHVALGWTALPNLEFAKLSTGLNSRLFYDYRSDFGPRGNFYVFKLSSVWHAD